MDEFLLITDLDNTLLGDDAAVERFQNWWMQNSRRGRIVYVSDRFFGSIAESIERFRLPAPIAVIGGHGTEIHHYQSGAWLGAWRDDLGTKWKPQEIRESLSYITGLQLRPNNYQSQYKLSFHMSEGVELKHVRQVAEAIGGAIELVHDSNGCLDVLPAGVNKGSAAAFVAWTWQYKRQQVIVCGDSADDLAMLRRFRAVIVGNGSDEVKSLVGPDIYRATAAFADGVVEGLEHWLDLPSLNSFAPNRAPLANGSSHNLCSRN